MRRKFLHAYILLFLFTACGKRNEVRPANATQPYVYPFDDRALQFALQFENGAAWHEALFLYISFSLPGHAPASYSYNRPPKMDSIALAAFNQIFDGYPPRPILSACKYIVLQIFYEQDSKLIEYYYSLYDDVFVGTWLAWPYWDPHSVENQPDLLWLIE